MIESRLKQAPSTTAAHLDSKILDCSIAWRCNAMTRGRSRRLEASLRLKDCVIVNYRGQGGERAREEGAGEGGSPTPTHLYNENKNETQRETKGERVSSSRQSPGAEGGEFQQSLAEAKMRVN